MESDDLFWYRRVGPIAGSSSDLNQAGMRTGGPQRRRKPRCASFLKRGAGMKSLPALPGAMYTAIIRRQPGGFGLKT